MIRKNLITGLILFLLVTNIATVATVLVHINRDDRQPAPSGQEIIPMDSITLPETQRVLFLTEQLGLNPEQQEAFRRLSMEYGREAKSISSRMSLLRDELLLEMDKDQPDQAVLDSLSEAIGSWHVALKKRTVDHYLGLKSHCTGDQQRMLYQIMRTVINPEGDVLVPRGQGRRQGAGPPADRGRGWRGRPLVNE
ncbi:MAG: periplasmic heavy metal sensor [Bacteroidales bacterium]